MLAPERAQLVFDSGGRCAYCRCHLDNQIFDLDHVECLASGGADTAANLAVTCKKCNILKSSATTVRDPVTGAIVPFFNPIRQSWSDHFSDDIGRVVGVSPIGRASATVLFRRTSQLITKSFEWPYQNLISNNKVAVLLNHTTGALHADNFTEAEVGVQSLLKNKGRMDKVDRAIVPLLAEWVSGSIAPKRASLEELRYWVRRTVQCLKHESANKMRRRHLLEVYSSCCDHLAEDAERRGDLKRTEKWRRKALSGYECMAESFGSWNPTYSLRVAGLRLLLGAAGRVHIKSCLKLSEERAAIGDFAYLGELSKACTLSTTMRALDREAVLEKAEAVMRRAGYAESGNLIQGTILRRELILSKIRMGCELDVPTLQWDLDFWRSHRLSNELCSFWNRVAELAERGQLPDRSMGSLRQLWTEEGRWLHIYSNVERWMF